MVGTSEEEFAGLAVAFLVRQESRAQDMCAVAGVAYVSLAAVDSAAACHNTLYVAVDTRSCRVTAPAMMTS